MELNTFLEEKLKIKWPLITFFSSVSIFTFVFGLIGWHGNDVEYKYYTSVRMHACDIFKNNRSTLRKFEPERCVVKRREEFVGQLIDVSCTSENEKGQQEVFQYKYSDIHTIYDELFTTYHLKIDGPCNG